MLDLKKNLNLLLILLIVNNYFTLALKVKEIVKVNEVVKVKEVEATTGFVVDGEFHNNYGTAGGKFKPYNDIHSEIEQIY